MSIGRSATQKPAGRAVWSAAGCVVEALESRRLLTGVTAASFAYIYYKHMLACAFDQNIVDDLSLSDWEFHNLTTNSTVDRETGQLTEIGGGKSAGRR